MSYTVEELWKLNVRTLVDKGIITQRYKQQRVEVSIAKATAAHPYLECLGHKLKVTKTTPNFGGGRLWFQCPCCDGRVADLYLYHDSIACRGCRKLTYPSKTENREAQLTRKLGWINRKLGGNGYHGNYMGKPKGMHLKTYKRLMEEDWRLRKEILGPELVARFGI